MSAWRDWPQATQAVLFVVGGADLMKKKGIIKPGHELDEKGMAVFREMEDDGFTVSDEEVGNVYVALRRKSGEEAGAIPFEDVVAFVMLFQNRHELPYVTGVNSGGKT